MLFKIWNPKQRPSFGERIGRGRRLAVRRSLTLGAVVAAALCAVAVPVLAKPPAGPVPGATYNARTTDGSYVVFTVSADGTKVISYEITGAMGPACQFTGEGGPPDFPGAPITNNSFTYSLGNALTFAGTFTGPQSATGTYHFHNDALGPTPACDSGVVSWTATTTAKPHGGSGGGGGGTGGPGSGGGTLSYRTQVSLHRIAASRLGGRITSRHAGCAARRTVTLWLGKRAIHKTRSAQNGAYRFARTHSVRGRKVHVTVAMRKLTAAAVCGAAASKPIGA
jgi:hypothetical protein